MSKQNVPILLSFCGLSNGKRNLFFGKLAYSPAGDLVFRNYNRLKTFFTIVALYRTRGIRHREFVMEFDHGIIKGTTDESGSFWCEVVMDERQTKLKSITLTSTGEQVSLTEDLYPKRFHSVQSDTIVISDLDDTLLHSFISNKLKQIKTLLFTTVEKRAAVVTMANLIKGFASAGAEPFYLSNSEQNLYPMLFRFLTINEFPAGPIFLRQYIRLQHMMMQKLRGRKSLHKRTSLEKIMEMFPDKKMILVGDNTQHDLTIYLEFALRYPDNIRYIIIREVLKSKLHQSQLEMAQHALQPLDIGLHYESEFPEDMAEYLMGK
jgi:phosphatidate phosphatase APP1